MKYQDLSEFDLFTNGEAGMVVYMKLPQGYISLASGDTYDDSNWFWSRENEPFRRGKLNLKELHKNLTIQLEVRHRHGNS